MRVLVITLLFASLCAAQETPLGDLARQERARREAEEAANFKPGVPPPIAKAAEAIPVHFLTIRGEAGDGEFLVKVNGTALFHNTYVHDLPIYISSMLLDGGNLMEVSLTRGKAPVDITIEERHPGEIDHQVLARFHADASETPTPITTQVRFYAHPRATPPLQLSAADRAAIRQLISSFYDALKRKDAKQVMALFEPAIADARALYPEGADFGQNQMTKMASLVMVEGFAMNPFDASGLELSVRGATVMVKRSNGQPVFSSSEIVAEDGHKTSVSAESILAKKIKGQWRLTLPFGF